MAAAVAAPNDDNGRRGYDRQAENNESQHQPKEKISGNGCLGRGCSNGSNSGGSLSATVALTTAEAAADDVRQGGGQGGSSAVIMLTEINRILLVSVIFSVGFLNAGSFSLLVAVKCSVLVFTVHLSEINKLLVSVRCR